LPQQPNGFDRDMMTTDGSVAAPISGIVPTRDRADCFARTLRSLAEQCILPAELIVVDASCDHSTRAVVSTFAADVRERGCRVLWEPATQAGAATQRNQGVRRATQPVICFFDDDVLFFPDCLARLWSALQSDPGLGGVNAMIVNQLYRPPRFVSRWMFRLMAGRAQASYAGRVLGPAVNLLPEDRDDLPDIVSVEWLNLGCTLYRREALPNPPFEEFFTGYSLGEDLALSLRVAKQRRLANVRHARIYHDSRSGDHKADATELNRMALVNRHYVMTKIIERNRPLDYAKLALWEVWQLVVAAARDRKSGGFRQALFGKLIGARDILRQF
jgi:glycosyltransferase involved in cell wall biosynthesis